MCRINATLTRAVHLVVDSGPAVVLEDGEDVPGPIHCTHLVRHVLARAVRCWGHGGGRGRGRGLSWRAREQVEYVTVR